MTSEWLVEMFEGDSADMCAEKFPLMSMGGRAEDLAWTIPIEKATTYNVEDKCLL